jgi:glucose-1-phosphate thymidylyltransferase
MDRAPELGPPILLVNRQHERAFRVWAGNRPIEILVEESHAEDGKLGPIGALARAVSNLHLSDDLLVLGGDNVFSLDLENFIDSFRGNCLAALFDIGDSKLCKGRYGVAEVEQGRMIKLHEKSDSPPSALVSIACYVFPRHLLQQFAKYRAGVSIGGDSPGRFLQWLLREEPIDCVEFTGEWHDIGERESYIRANLLRNDGQSCVHPMAEVRESILEESVLLGPCQVVNSVLRGCVVDDGVTLDGIWLENALVGRRTALPS